MNNNLKMICLPPINTKEYQMSNSPSYSFPSKTKYMQRKKSLSFDDKEEVSQRQTGDENYSFQNALHQHIKDDDGDSLFRHRSLPLTLKCENDSDKVLSQYVTSSSTASDRTLTPLSNLSYNRQPSSNTSMRRLRRRSKEDIEIKNVDETASGVNNILFSPIISFIRIFIGFKKIQQKGGTVIVVVCLETVALRYEVIIVEIDGVTELCRFYVSQFEIIKQLTIRNYTQSQRKNANHNKKECDCSKSLPMKLKSHKENISEENNLCNKEDDINLDTIDIRKLNDKSNEINLLIFPRIILKLLQHDRRSTSSKYRFKLLNDVSLTDFTIFLTLPDAVRNSIPYALDFNEYLSQVNKIYNLQDERASLKAFLATADAHSTSTTRQLDESMVAPRLKYATQNSINPNKLRWKLKWQKVIQQVILNLRYEKIIRNKWQNIISDKANLNVALLQVENTKAIHIKTQYRKFSTKTRRNGMQSSDNSAPFTVDDIAKYREDIVQKRQAKLMKECLKLSDTACNDGNGFPRMEYCAM